MGRKTTFIVTLSLMGICTALVGYRIANFRCLPVYSTVGPGAGYGLIVLRIVQGLAIGGEYGGAATYIAEHSPKNHRGYYTGYLQMAATMGMCISLAVILIVKVPMGTVAFLDWGWRLPFLISIVLVFMSLYIRMSLEESPMFIAAKDTAEFKKNPLVESFLRPYNMYFVALALFGATMGQGCVWYTSQFYSLTFLTTYAKVPTNDAYMIVGAALLLASPGFVIVGHLSDKFGRKPFMLAGLTLAVSTWYPVYIGLITFGFKQGNYQPVMLSFLVFIQVCYVTLVYGPVAAFLVELFPTSIRYTSMSLPYHIGNGVFGGLVPVIGVLLTTASHQVYAGLWFPMGCVFITLLVMICNLGFNSIVFVPETYQRDLNDVYGKNGIEFYEKGDQV